MMGQNRFADQNPDPVHEGWPICQQAMIALQSEPSSSSDVPVDAGSAGSFQDVQALFQAYVNIGEGGFSRKSTIATFKLRVYSLPFLGISIHFGVSCGREVQYTNGISVLFTSHNVPLRKPTFLLLFPLHDVS